MSADILTTSPVCLAIREGPTISEQTIPNLLGLVEIRRFVKYLEIITTPTPIPPNGIMIPPWTTPEDVYEFIKRSDKWGNYVQQTVGISEASLGSFRQAATQEQRAASTRRSRLIPADQADIRRIRERVAELDGRLTLAVERFEEAFERTRSMALQIASIMYQRNLGWHHNPAELPKPSLSQRTVYAATAIGMGATAIAPLITPPAEIRTVEEVGLEEQQTTEKVQTAQELFEQIRKNGFNLADLNAQMEAWLRENQPQGQEAQQQEENLPFAPEFVSLGPVESITAESIKANPQEFWQTLVENPNYIAMIRPHLMKVTELVDSWGANRDDILIGVVLAESPNGVIATAVTFRVDEENRIFFSAPGLPNLNYAEQPIEIVLYNKGPFTNFAVASDGGLLGPVDEVNGGFTIVQPEEGAEITKEGIIGVVILDADGRIWQDTGSEAPPPTPEPLRAMDEIILAGYEQSVAAAPEDIQRIHPRQVLENYPWNPTLGAFVKTDLSDPSQTMVHRPIRTYAHTDKSIEEGWVYIYDTTEIAGRCISLEFNGFQMAKRASRGVIAYDSGRWRLGEEQIKALSQFINENPNSFPPNISVILIPNQSGVRLEKKPDVAGLYYYESPNIGIGVGYIKIVDKTNPSNDRLLLYVYHSKPPSGYRDADLYSISVAIINAFFRATKSDSLSLTQALANNVDGTLVIDPRLERLQEQVLPTNQSTIIDLNILNY